MVDHEVTFTFNTTEYFLLCIRGVKLLEIFNLIVCTVGSFWAVRGVEVYKAFECLFYLLYDFFVSFWQGLVNSVLLPVVVIALVMLILKLNIDPAGPPLEMSFDMFKTSSQKTVVPVAGASTNVISALHRNDYLEFQAQEGMNNSVQMSEHLLQTYLRQPTRFGKQYDGHFWPHKACFTV